MKKHFSPFGLSILLLLPLASLSIATESEVDRLLMQVNTTTLQKGRQRGGSTSMLPGSYSCTPGPGTLCGPPLHLYSLSAWLKGGSARIVSGDSGTVLDTGRFLKVLHSRKDSVHGLPRVEVSRWEHPMKPKLRLEIRPDGRVRKAAVTCSECTPPVKDWLVGQARRLRFPASEGALQIVWRPEVRQGLRRPVPKLRTVSLAGADRKLLDSLQPNLRVLALHLESQLKVLRGEVQDVGDGDTLAVEFSIRPDGGVVRAARVPATDRHYDSIFLAPLVQRRFKPIPSEVRVRWRLRIVSEWR